MQLHRSLIASHLFFYSTINYKLEQSARMICPSSRQAMGGLPLILVIICLRVLIGITVAGARPPAMYVFGSSILDVGNNNFLPGSAVSRANRPHNGIDFPASIPTGRFSNGYNIADYVAKDMGFACSPPAYLSLAPSSGGPHQLAVSSALTNGVNYASGGAGILDSTVIKYTVILSSSDTRINHHSAASSTMRAHGNELYGMQYAGSTIPWSKQVQYFGDTKAKMVAAVGRRAVDSLLSRSIFLLGIGDNDVHVFAAEELARNGSSADADRRRDDAAAFYASLVSNYAATVTELYSMGARKFAVINVWPLGCVPGQRARSPSGACSDSHNQLAAGFNDALRSLLGALALRLPGLGYSLADSFGFATDVMADPQAFGYTDITAACCGGGRLGGESEWFPYSTLCANRDQHVFWDRVHPAQRTAFLIARAFYHGPWPNQVHRSHQL